MRPRDGGAFSLSFADSDTKPQRGISLCSTCAMGSVAIFAKMRSSRSAPWMRSCANTFRMGRGTKGGSPITKAKVSAKSSSLCAVKDRRCRVHALQARDRRRQQTGINPCHPPECRDRSLRDRREDAMRQRARRRVRALPTRHCVREPASSLPHCARPSSAVAGCTRIT